MFAGKAEFSLTKNCVCFFFLLPRYKKCLPSANTLAYFTLGVNTDDKKFYKIVNWFGISFFKLADID
jgi:hypothetical protein